MKRIFLTNLVLQLGLNLVIKPLYVFGVDLGVQNVIGKESFGTYFSILSFSYLFQMLNDFGIQNFTSSMIAKYPFLVKKYFSNLLIFKALLSSVYILLTFSVAWGIGYERSQIRLLFFVVFIQISSSFLLFFRATIAALGEFRRDSFLSVFDRVLLLILGFSLLRLGFFKPGDDALLFVAIQAFALTLSALLGFFIITKKISDLRLKSSFLLLKYFFRKGLPFAMIVFLTGLYTRIDVVLLERLLPDGKAEAGIFASSYRLIEALNSVLLIFGTLLLPIFSGMVARKESIKELLVLSLKIILFIGISAAVLVFHFRAEIAHVLYREATDYWSTTMGILFWSSIPLAAMYVLGALMTASGTMRRYNWITLAGVIFSLVANLILIPQYKVLGTVTVSVLTQFLIALLLMYYNMQFFKLRFDLRSVIEITIFSILLYLGTIFIRNSTMSWLIQFMMAGCFSIALSFITGLWNISNLTKLLKRS